MIYITQIEGTHFLAPLAEYIFSFISPSRQIRSYGKEHLICRILPRSDTTEWQGVRVKKFIEDNRITKENNILIEGASLAPNLVEMIMVLLEVEITACLTQ